MQTIQAEQHEFHRACDRFEHGAPPRLSNRPEQANYLSEAVVTRIIVKTGWENLSPAESFRTSIWTNWDKSTNSSIVLSGEDVRRLFAIRLKFVLGRRGNNKPFAGKGSRLISGVVSFCRRSAVRCPGRFEPWADEIGPRIAPSVFAGSTDRRLGSKTPVFQGEK
jgi:hypothetical protein